MAESSQRLPEDISRLLVLCIRDLLWCKNSIIAFLRDCGLPRSILLEVERSRDIATLKLLPEVLERLYPKGDEGF